MALDELRGRSRGLLGELGRMRASHASHASHVSHMSQRDPGRVPGRALTLDDLASRRSEDVEDAEERPAVAPQHLTRMQAPLPGPTREHGRAQTHGEERGPRTKTARGTRPYGRDDATLLGYDWIAGMLENGSPLDAHDDAFFEEINAFRKVNYNECHAPASLFEEIYAPRTGSEGGREGGGDVEDPAHVHVQPAFRINERLFPEPIEDPNLAEGLGPAHGKYVRISVPGKFIKTESKPAPRRRESFDPSNSCALSRHCLLGWENARPASLPPQHAADLRASTGAKPIHPLFQKHA
jgi:hypothetical protein